MGYSRSRSRSRSRGKRSRSRSYRRSRSRSRRRSYSRSRSPEDGKRLHVADLDSRAEKRDLEDVFEKFGPLQEIWMAKSSPCFAFVVFKNKDDAYEACRSADGEEICGRRIRVTIARPRTKGVGRRGFDPSMRCYQCGDKGHFSRDCENFKYGYRRPSSPRRGGRRRSRSRSRRSRSRSRSHRRSRRTRSRSRSRSRRRSPSRRSHSRRSPSRRSRSRRSRSRSRS